MDELALQDRYGADDICFGCGPRNPRGLRIKSRLVGDEVVADWSPGPDIEAFPGIVNGGIIATLLDCHSWWTAAAPDDGGRRPRPAAGHGDRRPAHPIHRPTPSGQPVRITARIAETTARRAVIDAVLSSAERDDRHGHLDIHHRRTRSPGVRHQVGDNRHGVATILRRLPLSADRGRGAPAGPALRDGDGPPDRRRAGVVAARTGPGTWPASPTPSAGPPTRTATSATRRPR